MRSLGVFLIGIGVFFILKGILNFGTGWLLVYVVCFLSWFLTSSHARKK